MTRIGHYEHDRGATTARSSCVFRGASPGEPDDRPRRELRDELRAPRRRRPDVPLPGAWRAPAREVDLRRRRVPGFGWRSYTVAAGRRAGDRRVASRAVVARQRAPRASTSTGDGTLRSHDADGADGARPRPLVDGGDGGDTYNYSPPRGRCVVDQPESRRRRRARGRPGARPRAHRRDVPVAAHAIGDERSCSRRARRDRRRHRCARRSSCAPASGSSACTPSSTTRAATTGCGPTSRCRRRSTRLRRRVRVRGRDRGLTAEGGPHEFGAPDVRVAPLRRRLRRRAPASRVAPRRPARVRGRRTTARRELALTLLRATGYLSRCSSRCGRTRPGRSIRSRAPQMLGRRSVDYALLPHRGDWRDADLHDAADEVLVPLERVRGGGVAGARRGRDRPRARRSTARRCRRCCASRAGCVVRVFNPSPDPCDGRRRARRGAGRPAGPSTCVGRPRGALRGRGRAAAVGDRHAPDRRSDHAESAGVARRARRRGEQRLARGSVVDQAGSRPGARAASAARTPTAAPAGRRASGPRTRHARARSARRAPRGSGRATRRGARRATRRSPRRSHARAPRGGRAPPRAGRRAVGPRERGRRRGQSRPDARPRRRVGRTMRRPRAARASRAVATPRPPRRRIPSPRARRPPRRSGGCAVRSQEERGARRRRPPLAARASGRTDPHPPASCASHPAAAPPASGSEERSTASTGTDRLGRPSASAQRSRVRCATGWSSATSSRMPRPATPLNVLAWARPTVTTSSVSPRIPAAQRIAGRGVRSAGRPSTVTHEPRVPTARMRPAGAGPSTSATTNGAPDAFSISTTTRPPGPPTPYDALHRVAPRHPHRGLDDRRAARRASGGPRPRAPGRASGRRRRSTSRAASRPPRG